MIPFISSTNQSIVLGLWLSSVGIATCMGVQGGRASGGLAVFCFLSWVLKIYLSHKVSSFQCGVEPGRKRWSSQLLL